MILKNFFKYFTFIFFIVFYATGCETLNLFDATPPPPYVVKQQNFEHQERQKYYTQLLIGKTRQEVIKIIGRPKTKDILHNRLCFCENCKTPEGFSNSIESYLYMLPCKGKYGYAYFSLEVHFKDDYVYCVKSG